MKQIFLFIAIISSFTGCSSSQSNQKNYDIKKISVGKGAGSVEVADLNKDKLPDIVVANAEDSSVSVLLNTGNRNFKPAANSPFYAGHFPNDITINDFNNDGNLDLGFANHEKKSLTILLGNGKGQFSPALNSPFNVQVKPHTHGIISADFNGDGNVDIATDSWGVDSIVIDYGDGKGNFSNPVFYATGKHPYQRLRTADFNNDGSPDIVTTNLDGANVSILMGDGKGNFSAHLFDANATPFGVAVGDVNGDGMLDLAIVNSPTITSDNKGKDGLTILLGDGKGNFSMLQGSPFAAGKSPSRIAVADLNNDGINDIVITNYNSDDISIFYMSGSGVQSSVRLPVGKHPDGVAIHDLDGDGKNDIIVSSYDENNITIFFGK